MPTGQGKTRPPGETAKRRKVFTHLRSLTRPPFAPLSPFDRGNPSATLWIQTAVYTLWSPPPPGNRAPEATTTLVRRALATLAGVTALVLFATSPAVADPGPPPNSMASLGDSITRGFNACGW